MKRQLPVQVSTSTSTKHAPTPLLVAVLSPPVVPRPVCRMKPLFALASGGYVNVAAKNVAAGSSRQFGERFFTLVITHVPAMMLGHAEAESALESSGLAARDGIALLPSECFGTFLQHLHRGHGFVR